MDDTAPAAEPLFRANKRRKVFRKPADSDVGQDTEINLPGAGSVREPPSNSDEEHQSALRKQVRQGARKHGIAFSSAGGRKAPPQQEDAEMALVPVNQDVGEEMQNDRFVRPTGREAVSEDKHMMAYVDSKLAEMRAAAASPAIAEKLDDVSTVALTANGKDDLEATVPATSIQRSSQSAQARSDRVYQRPNRRPRRKKLERDEADIARDAYIDQFMQEAQVPMYDRSASAKNAAADGEDGDNDAATAEAFKAQLLADMAMQRRRPPKSATEKAAQASGGPKLGGSRQQRERMRAMQEAEGKK